MQEFGRVEIGEVTVIAFGKYGGVSQSPYEFLNLGAYVGDNPESVKQNWQLIRDYLGATELTYLHAQHGTTINLATFGGEAPIGDGLICTKTKHAIAALSADCVAFALVDRVHKVIAVGHAGWRGVLANLMHALSQEFVKNGAVIQNSVAVIGPAICGKCYAVAPDRVELFKSKMPSAIVDQTHLDLSAAVNETLFALGYETVQIEGCNFENEELYSYRRSNGAPTGRSALVVIIN